MNTAQQLTLIKNSLGEPYIPQIEADAAVLLALQAVDGQLQVLLTRRADHLPTHAGEVAFPGGKREAQDETLWHTALREAHEEVGITSSQVSLLGALPHRRTRYHSRVVPFVGFLAEEVQFVPNDDEITDIFTVPVSFFMEDQRIRTDVFNTDGEQWEVPAFAYERFEIWGFTAWVLTDFLNRVFGAKINHRHPAPKKYWPPRT